MKKLAAMGVAVWALLSAHTAGAEPAASIQKVARAQKAKGIWIDVRSPEEFKAGHIQGALNIPFDQLGSHIQRVSRDKNAPVHLYCRSGNRVNLVMQTLKQMGYSNVVNHGGYQDLLQRGIR